tara:strand:- start:2217 stop:2897 length:681 start_codon:yes stop_codon:yes gene_type:complete
MRFLSIGGWCGTTISLRGNKLYSEAFPFDHVRSSFEGIIDCIENNFENFFPKKIEVDIIKNYGYSGRSFRGKYFGFYHHDLKNKVNIDKFKKRFMRFNDFLKTTDESVIFVRTIVTENYEEETKLYDSFIKAVEKQFPTLKFNLIFCIPGQKKNKYFKKIDNQTFIFTLNDKVNKNKYLTKQYGEIYSLITKEDFFKSQPENINIDIIPCDKYVNHQGVPFFREDN